MSLVVSYLDPICLCNVWLVRVNDASKHRCESRDFLDSICWVSLFPVSYNLRNQHIAGLNGIEMESRQIQESGKGKNSPTASFHIFLADFLIVMPFFSPIFRNFAQKRKKMCQKMEERERKEKHSFPFLFFTFPF